MVIRLTRDAKIIAGIICLIGLIMVLQAVTSTGIPTTYLKYNGTPISADIFMRENHAGSTGGTITEIQFGSGLTPAKITNAGKVEIDSSYLQRRVVGSCSDGITAVSENGSATCLSENTALFFFRLNQGNLSINGTLNVTNITLSQNCADGQILKWLNGVGQCGTDTTGAGSGGGNATASGATGYIPKFFNDTHLILSSIFTDNTSIGIGTKQPLSLLHIAGNVSINGTLFVEGINVTGRQIADNSTIANNLSSLNDRINTEVTLQAGNNATQAANITSAWTFIFGNNLTIESNLSSLNDRINNDVTLQAANNATQASNISSGWTFIFGNNMTIGNNLSSLNDRINNQVSLNSANNATIGNTAAFFYILNQGNLSINGTLNVSNITFAQNCADGQIIKWLNGVGQCGSDSTGGAGGGNASASGATGRLAYFFNNTHIIGANSVFFDNTSFGIGTSQPLSRLHVAGNVSINGTLFVEGINVTGRQIADNSTITNNLSSLNTRLNTQITLQANDNTTIRNNMSSLNDRINNEVTLQAANNATHSANISSAWTSIFGNNLTIINTALFFYKLNTGNLSINGTLNVTNITLAQNCADGQVLKWLNGVGTCGTDTSGSGASSLERMYLERPVWRDDFCSDTPYQQGDFWGQTVSTAGTTTIKTGDQWHPCVMSYSDSTTANAGWMTGMHITVNEKQLLLNGSEIGTFIFQPKAIATSWTVRLGFLNTITVTRPSNGCWFEYVDNTNLKGVCRDGGAFVNTSTTMATISPASWYKAVVKIINATQANFTVYNSTQGSTEILWSGTVDQQIPTQAGSETSFASIATQSTTGAGQEIIWMDYQELFINRTLVR